VPYQRKRPGLKLTKSEREELLREHWNFYRAQSKRDPSVLNRKLPRSAFSDLLDELGAIILDRVSEIASRPGAVRQFLDENPLPPALELMLPEDFRVFCLALNALKQWIAAEQAAADRYLLGGRARQECLTAGDVCLVTGDLLGERVELHHPVRDGRPPLPLSIDGHYIIEGQVQKSGKRAARSQSHDRRRKRGGAP